MICSSRFTHLPFQFQFSREVCYLKCFNCVQIGCIVKGEAQKSPRDQVTCLMIIFGELIFSLESFALRIPVRYPSITDVCRYSFMCLYTAPSSHIVEVSWRKKDSLNIALNLMWLSRLCKTSLRNVGKCLDVTSLRCNLPGNPMARLECSRRVYRPCCRHSNCCSDFCSDSSVFLTEKRSRI